MIKIWLIGSLIVATSSAVLAQGRQVADSNGHIDGKPPHASAAQSQTIAPDTGSQPAVTIDGLLRNADELLNEVKRDIDCAHAPQCRPESRK